jgi:hypothetical protein
MCGVAKGGVQHVHTSHAKLRSRSQHTSSGSSGASGSNAGASGFAGARTPLSMRTSPICVGMRFRTGRMTVNTAGRASNAVIASCSSKLSVNTSSSSYISASNTGVNADVDRKEDACVPAAAASNKSVMSTKSAVPPGNDSNPCSNSEDIREELDVAQPHHNASFSTIQERFRCCSAGEIKGRYSGPNPSRRKPLKALEQ